MDGHRGEFHKEYSLQELEQLKFAVEATPFEDMGALSVDDYLNNEPIGLVDVAFVNQGQDGIRCPSQETVIVAETSETIAKENVIMTDQTAQGENAEGSNAERKEETSLVANASDNNADIKIAEEGQKNNENSTKGKEKIQTANYSMVEKGGSSRAAQDDADADKMALITVPLLDQGQNIAQSSAEKAKVVASGKVTPNTNQAVVYLTNKRWHAQIAENSQVPSVTVISRVVSQLPLHLRLKGWQIKEHPRRDLKRKDKFYVHLHSDVQFRSLNEVDDFVHWGLHPKRQIKKRLLVDQHNSGLQAPKEGPPTKRSTRRRLAWEFHNKIFMNDGIVICDIRFPGAPNVIEDYTGSRGSQGTASSERTMSQNSGDSKEQDVPEENKEEEEEKNNHDNDEEEEEEGEEEEMVRFRNFRYSPAEVRMFFARALENLRNGGPDGDHHHNDDDDDGDDEATASSSSESTTSTSTTPPASTDTGGKMTQQEDDNKEAPSRKKPRV